MQETWKQIPGYESLYEASDLGRIRSLRTGGILKPHYFAGKYATYNLYDADRKAHCVRGYRAVYRTFIGEVPDGHEIDHIDDDTRNDRLANLQALTREENMKKSWRRRRANGYRARNQHTARPA